jgi:topoisomerase-4 subunit A
MRLRSLRKLEEIEIRQEHASLQAEQKELKGLVRSEDKQNDRLKASFQELRAKFGAKTVLGKRRSQLSDAPTIEDVPMEALIEKEPITVVCSDKGWIRAMKGHMEPSDDVKFKDGDKGRFWVKAQTTDKLVLFATNGRFFTLECKDLPGGRGHGEPVRLMCDLENDQDIVALFVARVRRAGRRGHRSEEGRPPSHERRPAGGGEGLHAGRGRPRRLHRREPEDGDLQARRRARDGEG